MPFNRATSLPRRWFTATSAKRESWMFLGSATMSLAPFSLALKIRRAISGWQAVVLDPMTKIQPASSISAMEFVMAPLPKAAARPATVEECQRRAQ